MDIKKVCYLVLRFVTMIYYGIFFPFKTVGRENVPDGAAVICANHSNASDPFFMAYCIPPRYHLCLMAKQELFRNKILAFIFHAIGTFPVNRGAADMNAMKNALNCLKDGKKLGIFPEGTRTAEDGSVSPKAGAVRLAEKAGAPIVPIYIPRQKKMFKRMTIIVGEPYSVKKEKGKLSKDELEQLADELMDKIARLGHTSSDKAA